MLKLIFFFLLIFIVYNVIKVVARIYTAYSAYQQQFQQQKNANRQYQEKRQGQTTIRYKTNGERKQSSSKKSSDEDYIDFEEIRE